MYPKALEKAPILNSGSKQSCVETGFVAQKIWNLHSGSGIQSRIQRFRWNSNQAQNGP